MHFFGFSINTTAFCSGQSSLHLPLLKSSMAYLVSSFDQHEHAVDADVGDGGEAERSADEAGVVDCHWQRQDTDPNVAFQDVDDCLEIAAKESVLKVCSHYDTNAKSRVSLTVPIRNHFVQVSLTVLDKKKFMQSPKLKN